MTYNYNIFQIAHNNIMPEKGSVLISEPFLDNKYFERSVVFLIDHDNKHGTMGFVLNKPMKETLNDFFPELINIEDIPLFRGGPVSANKLFFIHTLGDAIPGSLPINNGLYFDGDFDVVKNYLIDGNPAKGQFKFFLGYSGWDQKQLNNEISLHSWVVGKIDSTRIFKNEGESCWKKSLQDLGERYKSWANFPKRPFLN